jgi:DNA-binding response OmpR family regulator
LPDLLPHLNVLAARELVATAQPGVERPHVAVIMADHAVRLELWTQLLALGAAVTVFANAAAARAGLAALSPALILVDRTLPDADGAALAWSLRGDRVASRCPVCLLSTKVSWREVIRSAWRGLDGYLAVPAAPAELRRLVARYGAAFSLRPETAPLASP